MPEDHLIPKPAALSWPVAGSLYVVGTTAYAAVRAVGAGAGDTVVVSAAAGGVGSVTVQLLKVKGADVIGIASEPNHEWLSSIGVAPVAYGDGLAERIRSAAPDGVDAFIDTFGEEYVRLAIELGVAPDRIDTIIAYEVAAEVGAKAEGSATTANTEVLGEMADLVAAGRIDVPIAATFPLDQVPGRLCRAGGAPYPGEDRPHPLTGRFVTATGAVRPVDAFSLGAAVSVRHRRVTGPEATCGTTIAPWRIRKPGSSRPW